MIIKYSSLLLFFSISWGQLYDPETGEIVRKQYDPETGKALITGHYNEVEEETDIFARYNIKKTYLPLLKVTCKYPYRLTEDCSSLFGGKQKITLDEYKFNIASSEDGQIVMVNFKSNKLIKASIDEKNKVFESFYNLFSWYPVYIQEVVILLGRSWMNEANGLDPMLGFILVFDGDGYSILKRQLIQ